MSIEAAFVGVDPQGNLSALRPSLSEMAVALFIGVCDEATVCPVEGHEDSSLDVLALWPECVQAIAELGFAVKD